MSAKFGPRRKAAFLDALTVCGNVTLAAERVCVSRSWVCLHRASDPAFDAGCRGAVREAKARLGRAAETLEQFPHPAEPGAESPSPPKGSGGNAPPDGWGFLDGAELVVRGSPGRRTQIARARAGQWGPRIERRFLNALRATCNVKAAYAHRHRWPAFAAAWDGAIEEGYARIEIALVERGCNLFSVEIESDEPRFPAMTVDQAIHLLHMHKHAVRGIGKAPGTLSRRASLDEVKESILRKIAAIRRGEALSAEQRADDEAAYAARRMG